ncbi:hypothetical protein [Dyella lutea]|uniref:LysB family phage lysis regulatory protein n=1 Tax=Dyella lutea TaxID=2950441 RepID=A0ABT1FG27_9GAMM|nr:hypothetical protein [Dyella lutea]MCP1375373.1 hypothetical protein [Dyella lutea]
MSVKDLAEDVGILLIVGAIAFGAGVVRGDSLGTGRMTDKVNTAQAAKQAADQQARAATGALADISNRLALQKAELDAMRTAAKAALDQRDAAQRALEKLTRQRIAAVEKLAHEDQDCRALERMPLCPAIAHRLFQPDAAADAGATGGAGAGADLRAGAAPAH